MQLLVVLPSLQRVRNARFGLITACGFINRTHSIPIGSCPEFTRLRERAMFIFMPKRAIIFRSRRYRLFTLLWTMCLHQLTSDTFPHHAGTTDHTVLRRSDSCNRDLFESIKPHGRTSYAFPSRHEPLVSRIFFHLCPSINLRHLLWVRLRISRTRQDEFPSA